MNTRIVLCFIVATTFSLFAQSADSVQREGIKQLDWWVGQWKGDAWSSMGPGRRDTTMMVETIRKNLDGTIILIEGLGRRKMPPMEEGDIVHHAFAVLSYNDKKQSYRWQAWRIPGGIYTEIEPIVKEDKFYWSMETPRGKMKYSVTLNDKGQWEEIGEFSSDGQTWRQFFGMLLSRVQ
jgi:hypothetical protein